MQLDVKFSEMGHSFSPEFGELTPVSGKNGLSAYEIAVAKGFEGTEAEWLESLHGRDGRDGQDGQDGEDGRDGVIWTDLGEFDDPYAEMDNIIDDGYYRLSDGEFVYSLHVERLKETYLGQTYWNEEEGRTQFYCRSAWFNASEGEWEFDTWDVLCTYSALSQYSPKNHAHRTSLNTTGFESWINVFRAGQHQINIRSEDKSYIVDQIAFNNRPTTTIHCCQRYYEVSEPWIVYARHGTTDGNYVLVDWDEWHVTGGGDG